MSPSRQGDDDMVWVQEEVLSKVEQFSNGVDDLSLEARILARKPHVKLNMKTSQKPNTLTPKVQRKRGKELATKMTSYKSDLKSRVK
eukprot:8960462-Ditylum_brightwellii.AAC.1